MCATINISGNNGADFNHWSASIYQVVVVVVHCVELPRVELPIIILMESSGGHVKRWVNIMIILDKWGEKYSLSRVLSLDHVRHRLVSCVCNISISSLSAKFRSRPKNFDVDQKSISIQTKWFRSRFCQKIPIANLLKIFQSRANSKHSDLDLSVLVTDKVCRSLIQSVAAIVIVSDWFHHNASPIFTAIIWINLKKLRITCGSHELIQLFRRRLEVCVTVFQINKQKYKGNGIWEKYRSWYLPSSCSCWLLCWCRTLRD